jgi:hypothetical protein
VTKTSGLGDGFYWGGYDLSGEINALGKVASPIATLDVTPINVRAHVRIPGLRDGAIDFTALFDPAAGHSHPVLATLPRTDVVGCYFVGGQAIGNAAACMVAKQVDYNPTRGADGMLSSTVASVANSYGLDWADQLTAGLRTDTAATNGASRDFTASTSFGFQAYLQVTAFTGTDVTVKLQDSADNVTFADLASGAFTQTTAAHTAQRIAVGGTATVRRYVRAVTVTSGGFTSVTFAVALTKNAVATVVF